MTDAERKVKQLKRLIKTAHNENYDFVYVPVGDAKTIVRLLERKEGYVRCIDCRHYLEWTGSDTPRGYCELLQRTHKGEWFCADGEVKEDER